MWDLPYVKTELGREEIKSRQLPLQRSQRNLLLLLDGSKTAAQWLALVQGCHEADLHYLLAEQLIVALSSAAVAEPVLAPESPVSTTASASAATSALQDSLEQPALYAYLTAAARQRLGLIKGYRWVLEVERCADLAALQALAWRFVDEVRRAQGDGAAGEVRRAMGLRE